MSDQILKQASGDILNSNLSSNGRGVGDPFRVQEESRDSINVHNEWNDTISLGEMF